MRLVVHSTARRILGLAILLFLALPFGMSVTGCSKHVATVYCNGLSSGPVVGQVASITLSPTLATTGLSLNYGQIGTSLSATAVDCKNNSVSVSKYTYASSDMSVVDINPSTGSTCAGSWNRNTGGGVADYTICTAPATVPSTHLAYITATASGASSNAIPVFVHSTVTSVTLGAASTDCINDPATNCTFAGLPAPTTSATPYLQNTCVSQTQTAQLIARVYAGTTNITAQVGHLTFTALTSSSVGTIDENGVVTANMPGSSAIAASIANSSTASEVGFFSTCPPTSIVMSIPGAATGTSSISVSLNTTQSLNTVVYDKNGQQLTGLTLGFESTTPQTIPASSGSATPSFPGSALINAVCMPSSCNPAPFSQIGYLGNGVPLTSNGITINTTGTSATVLFIGSTQSQYLYPYDTTTGAASSLIKLQFVPNTMVMNQGGTEIYLGSAQGMMVVSTASLAQTSAYTSLQGQVLSVSPDGSTVVVTDPNRQTISLVSASTGAVSTSYNGVGTSAAWTPDSSIVYITTTADTLLKYSAFTNWQSDTTTVPYSAVAVTVPAVGAYFAGQSTPGAGTTDGRSYCPSQTAATGTTPPSITNDFIPLADTQPGVINDVLVATNDGARILGATAASPARINDLAITLPKSTGYGSTVVVPAVCPTTVATGYFSSTNTPHNITGPTITSITGVVPSPNSALAFVTYNGSGGLLPEYVPATGTVSTVTLANGATSASAPVAGVFSSDNLTFWAGTSSDDQVHTFSISGTTPTETGVIVPKLPCSIGSNLTPTPTCTSGSYVMPNLLSQHPKKSLN
ncbi:hypothetical protein SAMN05421819_3224 [Bryocella elongata]|uniref:Uncharacterized protein n=1 Tax=Bryocella elongata TaxID=863522 RepID=A0A1H6ALR7_9BACT|nr:hypothetical protein [Bryocella elongata]SEG49160.1 hypothetical protein SAMN05421819_3224 [Bryocella elongata]